MWMLQLVLVCKTNKDIASTGYSDDLSGAEISLKLLRVRRQPGRAAVLGADNLGTIASKV